MPLSIVDQIPSLDLAASVDPIIVSADPQIRRTSTRALTVRNAVPNDYLIVDTTNRRLGIEGIPGVVTFAPAFALHAEYESAAPVWALDFFGALGASPELTARKAEGTQAAPVEPSDGSDLLTVSARGFEGAAFSGPQASLIFRAAGPWEFISRPTRQVFRTTPVASNTPVDVMVLAADGCVIVTGQTNGLTGAADFERLRVEGSLRQRVDSATAYHLLDAAGNTRVRFRTLPVDGPARYGFTNAPGAFSPSFLLHLQTEETGAPGVYLDSFGTGIPVFMVRRARGTKAAPAALLAGDQADVMAMRGHDGTAFAAASSASVRIIANQNFTPTARGTRMEFQTTPDGSTTAASRYTIEANGNLTMEGNFNFVPLTDGQGQVGTAVTRFALVRAVTITAGDLAFENGWRVTEDYEDEGLVFQNRRGLEIFAVRRSGLYFRGRKIAAELSTA